MSSDRNRLLIQGGPRAGESLPWHDWAAEFADGLPADVVDAIRGARAGRIDDDLDDSWRDQLAARFGDRWRQTRLVLDATGESRTNPTDPGTEHGAARSRRRPRRRTGSGTAASGQSGQAHVGAEETGDQPARRRRVARGLPKSEWIDNTGDGDVFEPGMFAVWNPPSAAEPDGLVQLNLDHPVFTEEVRHWKDKVPDHLAEDVEVIVKQAYSQLAVATVAHSEQLAPHLHRREDVDDKLRSQEALTAALLGLIGAANIIKPKLGGLGIALRE